MQQTTKTPIGQLNNKNSQLTAPTTKVTTNRTLVNYSLLINAINEHNASAKMKQNVNSSLKSLQKKVVPVVIAEKQEVSGVNKQVQKFINNNDVNSSNSSSIKGKRGRPKKSDRPTIPVSYNQKQQSQQQPATITR